MSWKSYFWSQTIARLPSLYNNEIRVSEDFGKRNLIVGGSLQSGPFIEKLWGKAIRTFAKHLPVHPHTILVLGVAGGSVISILRRFYPNAAILGVEIDPVMIDVGEKFFSLRQDRYVTVVQEDARAYVDRALSAKRTFDLVLVDTFFGRHVVPWVSDAGFLTKLKRLVTRDGAVIINFLRENEYRNASEILLDKLRHIFHSVSDTAVARNRFFCARP